MVDDVSVDEKVLKQMTFAVQMHISEKLAKDFAIAPSVTAMYDWRLGGVALQIHQCIYGRKVKEIEAKYPTTWWDAVKERFAPEWFKRRWPVCYTHIKLTARELYPHIAMPERSPVMNLMKLIDGFEDEHRIEVSG